MILIGTMNWASTRLRGLFRCPQCGDTQNFRLKASRPFLTLYFVPILPIGGVQEYVQCTKCKNSYETDILASTMTTQPAGVLSRESNPSTVDLGQPAPATAPWDEDLLKLMALMMVEDGHVTEVEIGVARQVFEKITGATLTRDNLGRMCAYVQQQRLTTLSFLATAGKRRSHDEKLLLVQALFAVAGAEGQLSPKRLQSLVQTQTALELEEGEFQRAVAAAEQWLG